MAPTVGRMRQAAIVAGLAILSSSCALRLAPPKPPSEGGQARSLDFGIPTCPDGAAASLLSDTALQCWFAASHGRWRRLNQQSHLEALVIEVEAEDLRDAALIAQRLVADPMAGEFSEILVYVARAERGESRVRRVRWARGRGYDTLDFSSPAHDTPLTIRSSPGSATSTPQPKP
jgi:hypothetical protein